MPFISDAQVARLQNNVAAKDRQIDNLKTQSKAKNALSAALILGEAAGGAGLMGFLRGKFEATDGSWFIPGTPLDIELMVGLGFVAAGMLPGKYSFGKTGAHLVNIGSGVVAHYVGQLGRQFAKSGKFGLIAGQSDFGAHFGLNPMHVGMLPEYVGRAGVAGVGASSAELAQALAASAAG